MSSLCTHIQPQELLSLGWKEEPNHHLVPHVMKILHMSRNVRHMRVISTYCMLSDKDFFGWSQLSHLVCKEVQGESMEDDQASVISYFVQTAKVRIIKCG